MLTIGLTGGIGSGKSKVADFFASWGAAVVDTDVIAHELTAAGGLAIEPIRDAFWCTGTGCGWGYGSGLDARLRICRPQGPPSSGSDHSPPDLERNKSTDLRMHKDVILLWLYPCWWSQDDGATVWTGSAL